MPVSLTAQNMLSEKSLLHPTVFPCSTINMVTLISMELCKKYDHSGTYIGTPMGHIIVHLNNILVSVSI